MCCGLPIPNPCLSIPSRTANAPEGWTKSGVASSLTALYGDSPQNGHARVQRWTVTGTGSAYLLSPPAAPGLGTLNASTKFYGVLLHRLDKGNPGDTVTVYIRTCKSDGSTNQSLTIVNTSASTPTTWTLLAGESSATPGALSHHARILLALETTGASDAILDIAFVGLGCWNGNTAGHYTFGKYPIGIPAQATDSTIIQARRGVKLATGGERRVDRDRFTDRRRMKMGISMCDETMQAALLKGWQHNMGRAYQEATTNPGGGRYPLMITTQDPALPQAGLYDFDGTEFPLKRDGSYATDPTFFGGVMNFTEVLEF